MPLKPLPLDPEPSGMELASYLSSASLKVDLPSRIAVEMARLAWRSDRRREDPNMFAVRDAPLGYGVYLESCEWASVMKRVLVASCFRCAGCYGKATQSHHRDYRPRVMSGEDIEPLLPLCRSCHGKVHAGMWEHAAHEQILASLIERKDAQMTYVVHTALEAAIVKRRKQTCQVTEAARRDWLLEKLCDSHRSAEQAEPVDFNTVRATDVAREIFSRMPASDIDQLLRDIKAEGCFKWDRIVKGCWEVQLSEHGFCLTNG